MRICILSGFIILAGTVHSIAQEVPPAPSELLSVQKVYQVELDKIEQKYDGVQAEAVADYEKQLTALEDKMTTKGDLEGVVAVQAEEKRFKASSDLQIPEKAIVKAPAELNTLQMKLKTISGQLQQGKNGEIAKLATAYIGKLETVKTDLVKAKKVQEALVVKAEIDKVKGSVDLSMAPIVPSSPSKNLPQNLRNGLILWFSFDTDEGETVSDCSGAGHHGQATDMTWMREGISGGSMSFNGNSSFISSGKTNSNPRNILKDISDAKSITLCMWVLFSNGPTGHRMNKERQTDPPMMLCDVLEFKERQGRTGGFELGSSGVGTAMGGCNFWLNSSGNCIFVCKSLSQENVWVHLAAVYGRDSLSFYLDGKQIESENVREYKLLLHAKFDFRPPARFLDNRSRGHGITLQRVS